jgi:hypothetical protein
MESTEWVVVFESSTDYESDLVRDRLDDAGIPAIVESKRPNAFSLNVGELAQVFVRVPAEHVKAALAVLQSAPFSDRELNEAARRADPTVPRSQVREIGSSHDVDKDPKRIADPDTDGENET